MPPAVRKSGVRSVKERSKVRGYRFILPVAFLIGVSGLVGIAPDLTLPRSALLAAVLEVGAAALVAGPIIWFVMGGAADRAAAAEKLRASARVANVLATSIDGIVIADARGVVSHFNSGAETIFGYQASEVVGRHVSMLVPARSRAAAAEHVAAFAGQATGSRAALRLLHVEGLRKNGDEFPADVAVSGADADGDVALMAIVRDTTERQQAVANANVAQARLRAVLNSAPIAIWATDTAGTFILSDGLGLKKIGREPGELVGTSMLERFGTFVFADVDGRPSTVNEVMRRALAGETIVVTNALNGATFESHIGPQRGADGAIVGVVGVAVDITERTRAEAARALSEARFKAIFDKAPMGISVSDAGTGRFVAVNTAYARLVGRSVDDLLDRDWKSITHPDDVAHNDGIRAAIHQGTNSTYVAEKRYLRSDGTSVWVKVTATSMPADVAAADARRHALVMAEDISERRLTHAELEENRNRMRALSRRLLDIQESERRMLARELHDEIGQSLSAAKINLQSAQRFPNPDEATPALADSVRTIDAAILRVRSLSLALRPPLLDELGLVAALRWLVDAHARRTRTVVEFRGPDSEARFDSATEIACFRIAQEALHNVEKHAGASGAAVDLGVEDDELHVRVSDDGVSFDVAAARQRATAGASLGLLAMEERAMLVGGRVEWRSEPGLGTEVRAWFPLRRDADGGREAAESA